MMQDYNRAIGQCFLDMSQTSSQGSLERMQQLTIEALTLTGRVMLIPGMHKIVMSGRLDTGGPSMQKPDTAWYKQLLVTPTYMYTSSIRCSCVVDDEH